MISHLAEILRPAERKKYAVPAFNVTNLESVQAVIRAAVHLHSPVIVQTSETALRYAGEKTLFDIISNVIADEAVDIPVAIHLDHGKDLALLHRCLQMGYTSVHLDASDKNFKQNVHKTAEAAKLAHAHKTSVQGELGAIMGAEGLTKLSKGFDYRLMMTDPAKAALFVRQTKIDTLAISVGTIHGSFRGIEKIDLKLLAKIHHAVSLPLVLHGGSGNKPVAIKQAIKLGVRIINVDTDLRLAWVKAYIHRAAKIKLKGKIDQREILYYSTAAMQLEAEKIIKLFGSANKA